MVRRNSGERTPVDVNVITSVASDPNADVFRSYLGVLACDRINILTPSFDHVSVVERNIIWNDLLDSLVEHSSQGKFTLKGRQDILTTAIGRPEHPGQEHVMPPTAPAVPGDDMDEASPCLLYILDGTETMLVDRGTVFQAAIVVHGMELSEDEMRFSLWHRHSSLLSLGLNTWLVLFLTPRYGLDRSNFYLQEETAPQIWRWQRIEVKDEDDSAYKVSDGMSSNVWKCVVKRFKLRWPSSGEGS
ncbi:hypothetical protein LR48_Vigan03g075600 [Vigna angularis]|uniref:Uncharacterized protein n=1 Tax=Phaseolus angularis TaxID=3914 RepID=A0A0L9U4P8_PHAAN|nr:hypothetical protein LR48_Vigan03g075600 [Vigna angularis]